MGYVMGKRKPGAVRHLSPQAWLRRYAKHLVNDWETRVVPQMRREAAHNRLANQVHDYLLSADWFVIRTHDSRHTPIEAGVCDPAT